MSAAQLCEVLPLVQSADLAVPKDWLEQAMSKIQVRTATVVARAL